MECANPSIFSLMTSIFYWSSYNTYVTCQAMRGAGRDRVRGRKTDGVYVEYVCCG